MEAAKEEVKTERERLEGREAEVQRRESALLEQSEAVRLGALAVETATQQQKALEEHLEAKHREDLGKMTSERDAAARQRDATAEELEALRQKYVELEELRQREASDLGGEIAGLKARLDQTDVQSQVAALSAEVGMLKTGLARSTELAQAAQAAQVAQAAREEAQAAALAAQQRDAPRQASYYPLPSSSAPHANARGLDRAAVAAVAVSISSPRSSPAHREQPSASSPARSTAGISGSQQAYDRLQAFRATHEIQFVGPTQAESEQDIEMSWSLNHPDESIAELNHYTIAGIASVLLDFPSLRTEVHGETGNVRAAPVYLASYFGLDPKRDVQACMDSLASRRANACLEALVAAGVPREQLFATHRGRGGQLQIDFIPHEAATPRGPPPQQRPQRPQRQQHAKDDEAAVREAKLQRSASELQAQLVAAEEVAVAKTAELGARLISAEQREMRAREQAAMAEEAQRVSAEKLGELERMLRQGGEEEKELAGRHVVGSPREAPPPRPRSPSPSGEGGALGGSSPRRALPGNDDEGVDELAQAVELAGVAAAELTLENEGLRVHLDSATATTTELTKKVGELTKLLQEESAAHSLTRSSSVAAMLAAASAANDAIDDASIQPQGAAPAPESVSSSGHSYRQPASSDPSTRASTPRSMERELEERRRALALARQELEAMREGAGPWGWGGGGGGELRAAEDGLFGSAGRKDAGSLSARVRPSAAVALLGGGDGGGEEASSSESSATDGQPELAALMALASHRTGLLKAARAELHELATHADELLALPHGAISLRVSLSEMSVIPSIVFDAISCIALGTERVISPSAAFTVYSATIDEVEIELWDAEASHMIGGSTLSIVPLLSGERSSLDEELDVRLPGGPSLGSIRVSVDATAVGKVAPDES